MEKNTVVRSGDRARTIMKEYVLLSFGTLLTTVGLYVFAMPHQFVMGGVTGISIVLAPVFPSFVTPGVLVTVMNILLLLIGFAFLGRDFGFKTVYTSLFLSGVGMLIEWIGDQYHLFPLTDNLLLELVLAVLLPAIGTAIVFYYNGSGGGTDIVALIMKKYLRIEGGKALLCVDFLIMLVSFTYSVEIGLLSMLGLFAKSMIVDKVTKSMLRSKYCIIVTTHPDEIGEYINKKLHRGATMWKGMGVYTHEEKHILLVVMNAKQIRQVRRDILMIDSRAFTIVEDTSDVIGNGFRALV
ncbi:MAG: YitT family protein [Clostridia bacterium]|nr:YitT family protein [Clostridia bacterium]